MIKKIAVPFLLWSSLICCMEKDDLEQKLFTAVGYAGEIPLAVSAQIKLVRHLINCEQQESSFESCFPCVPNQLLSAVLKDLYCRVPFVRVERVSKIVYYSQS